MPKEIKYGGRVYTKVEGAAPKLKLTEQDLDKMGLISINGRPMFPADLGSMEDLVVGHDLDLTQLKIRKLPRNLTVRGDLTLGPSVKALPERLEVESLILLYNSGLQKFGANTRILSDLDLSNSRVTELPPGFYVEGTLVLPQKFRKLPSDLTVAKDLVLWGTRIQSLPPGIHIGGEILIDKGDPIRIPRELAKKVTRF